MRGAVGPALNDLPYPLGVASDLAGVSRQPIRLANGFIRGAGEEGTRPDRLLGITDCCNRKATAFPLPTPPLAGEALAPSPLAGAGVGR